MIEHTHNLTQWATRYGRKLEYWVRPEKTKQKGYREPVKVKNKWFKTAAEAVAEKQKYDA